MNRKKKPESLSYIIWKYFARLLVIAFIAFVFVNVIFIEGLRTHQEYDELETNAMVRKEIDKEELSPVQRVTNKFIEEILDLDDISEKKDKRKDKKYVPMAFKVLLDDKGALKEVVIEKIVKEAYFHHEEDQSVIDKVVDQVVKSGEDKVKGKENKKFQNYYYYALKEGNSYWVYMSKSDNTFINYIFVMILLIILLVLIFIISKRLARKIAAPIEVVQEFSRQIADKNWDYEPKMSGTVEINELIESLSNAQEALEEADLREKEFLQAASHDLKTPVMIIKGYTQAVKDGKIKKEDTSYVEIIQEEATRLERKIVQLLRLNTLEHVQQNQPQWEVINLERMLRRLVNKYQVICPHLKWHLDLREYEITGDVESMLIAFENLLDNQIRFAKEKIEVQITSEGMITIANDGAPFTLENPDELFESHRKDQQGNFGLGLAIVRRVVTLHGGKVVAYNNSDGKGVTFEITFKS